MHKTPTTLNRRSARWLCLALLLAALPLCGYAFPSGTTITLDPYRSLIWRWPWISLHPLLGTSMPTFITTSRYGLDPVSNQIKLQGHRQGTLWPDEKYWSMPVTWVYFSFFQNFLEYDLPFGPACVDPPWLFEWNQVYRYTGIISAGGVYVSDTFDLDVWDVY